MERWREGRWEGGREGWVRDDGEMESGMDEEREGGTGGEGEQMERKEGWREGRREGGGRERGREEGRDGGREGGRKEERNRGRGG